MSDWRDVMREVAARTEPTPAQLAQVRNGLAARAARGTSWAAPAGVVAVGLTGLVAWFALGPSPAAAPERVAVAAGVERLGAIAVRAEGVGEALGTEDRWSLDWSQGRVALDVPTEGALIEVRTPEAVVRAAGTAFAVDRSALGTLVAPERGAVEVACVAGSDGSVAAGPLAAGEFTTCLPATATGLLGRARALADRGAGPDQVLAALDAGLASDADPQVRAEIQAQRIGPLSGLGRLEDALAAAEAVVAAAGPRAEEARHASAALAWSLGGCDRARTHLAAIAEPTEVERAWLASCR